VRCVFVVGKSLFCLLLFPCAVGLVIGSVINCFRMSREQVWLFSFSGFFCVLRFDFLGF